MSKQFEDMTNQELIDAVAALKLTDKVKEIAANPSKPNKTELLQVLNDYKKSQSELNPGVASDNLVDSLADDPDVIGNDQGSSGKSMEELLVSYAETGMRVIITDHDNTQDVKGDTEGRCFSFSGGNTLITPKTFNISLDGEPQYVENAALLALEGIKLSKTINDSQGKPKVKRGEPRFKITPVEGLSEDELEALKQKQISR